MFSPDNLKDRVLSYELNSTYKLTQKLPVIITLNGRSFRKLTSLLEKPYAEGYSNVMGQVLIKLASEIEGATLCYSFNDEINIICRNDRTLDTEAWYGNDVQKIASAASSIASVAFQSAAAKKGVKLLGEPTFLAKVFIVPSITESINYLVSKQIQASHTAISMACFYELLKKYEPEKVLKSLNGLSIDEKYELLTNECGISLQDYDLAFWRGMACYRVPKVFDEEVKYKLTINDELPFFTKDQHFLNNILKKADIR